ncbi:hypothetical protein RRF57_009492 [Xylaria bambusicola]|uniref:Uncharacterized protein n=1 Tax=Xylaria bambusicola TaxID=326684 RepID=A0AAN7UQ27_9PEZI
MNQQTWRELRRREHHGLFPFLVSIHVAASIFDRSHTHFPLFLPVIWVRGGSFGGGADNTLPATSTAASSHAFDAKTNFAHSSQNTQQGSS